MSICGMQRDISQPPQRMHQTPRDALESFVYILCFVLKGTLLWATLGDETTPELVLERKKEALTSELLVGVPMALHECMRYVRGLDDSSAPNYEMLRNMFNGDEVHSPVDLSLEQQLTKCGRKFSVKTTCMLAKQMITSIEMMSEPHDITPSNFVIGSGDKSGCIFPKDSSLI